MVNIQFSEFLRNSTLMASGNSAACQNKSPAWPSPGLVCPGGRLFMRISLTVTAQLRDEQGMKGGSLSSRNHSLAARAMGPTFNFKPRRSRSSHGPCTQRLFFGCGGEEWWVFTWSLLLTFLLKAHLWACSLRTDRRHKVEGQVAYCRLCSWTVPMIWYYEDKR